ncbi:hypothetical protein [Streptomyces sp. NPDC056188]|uniref:hypothetical protein n=1 Tax=Streptomyces sp. NPDC056188 TaxID=3345740 RepID=UPI0035E0CBBC
MQHRTAPTLHTADALLEVPAAALRLLVQRLPDLDAVPDVQARGIRCVWCSGGPLTAETAINLGEQRPAGVTRFPRACRRCTGRHAYSALLDHAPGCEECCAAAPGCEIGRILNRLIRQGRGETT